MQAIPHDVALRDRLAAFSLKEKARIARADELFQDNRKRRMHVNVSNGVVSLRSLFLAPPDALADVDGFAVGTNRRVILAVILYPNCQGFTDAKASAGNAKQPGLGWAAETEVTLRGLKNGSQFHWARRAD